MSDESKSSCLPATGEPTATSATVPIWIIVLLLMLLFLGGVYFDYHSGWFNAKVYGPYASAEQLDLYQPKSGAAAIAAQGKKVYENVCGICHGNDGTGKPGIAPLLAGSEWVNTKGDQRLIHIPLEGLNGTIEVNGQQLTFPNGMVAVGKALSDADLAAVLTYIRSSWGNKGSTVTADDVKTIRAAVGEHPAITGAELKGLPE